MSNRSKWLKIKSKNYRQNLAYLPMVSFALLVLGGYLVYHSLINNFSTPLQIAEIKNTTGTVNLILQAEKTELTLDEETTITVAYDSPTDKLATISGEITYDPSLLTLSNFTRDNSFPNELIAASTTSHGKLIFSYSATDSIDSGLTGQGNILTFAAKAIKPGSATLAFTGTTDVRLVNVDTSALREITNTTLVISDPTLSPSPSATSSPTPLPSKIALVVNKPPSPNNLRYNCYNNGTRITLRWDTVTDATGYEIVFDQKDGDQVQTKSSTRAEIDLDIKGNTLYTWKVATKKDSILGEYSTVNDVKCSSEGANNSTLTPTPTPNPSKTPTPTPKKSTTPITKKIANVFTKSSSLSPSPKPSLISSNTPTPAPGSLSDIFGSPLPSATPTSNNSHNLWQKIVLGWQALFYRLVDSMTR